MTRVDVVLPADGGRPTISHTRLTMTREVPEDPTVAKVSTVGIALIVCMCQLECVKVALTAAVQPRHQPYPLYHDQGGARGPKVVRAWHCAVTTGHKYYNIQ